MVSGRCFDKVAHSRVDRHVAAPTGSGKTTIFDLAFIRLQSQVENMGDTKPLALYMAPTKASKPTSYWPAG